MKTYTRPSIGIPTPEAADRAYANVDALLIEVALEEARVTPAAQAIRSVWAGSFERQGNPFPDMETKTYDQTTIKHDPIRNGIALWQLATGENIYETTIRRDTVEAIISSIHPDQTTHPFFGVNYRQFQPR